MPYLIKKTFSDHNVSFSISNLRKRVFKVMNNNDLVAIINLKINKDNIWEKFANIKFEGEFDEDINNSIMKVYIEFLNKFSISVGYICQYIKKGSYKYHLPENIINKYFICSKDNIENFNINKSKTFICTKEQIDKIKENGIDIYFPMSERYNYFVADKSFTGHIFNERFSPHSRNINLIAYSSNSFENTTLDISSNVMFKQTPIIVNIIKKYSGDEPLIIPKILPISKDIFYTFSLYTDFNQRIKRNYNIDLKNVKNNDMVNIFKVP